MKFKRHSPRDVDIGMGQIVENAICTVSSFGFFGCGDRYLVCGAIYRCQKTGKLKRKYVE